MAKIIAIKPELTIIKKQIWVSSVNVSEMVEIPHKDVLKTIRTLVEDLKKIEPSTEPSRPPSKPEFLLSEYTDPTGRKLPLFIMNEMGLSVLMMRFRSQKALEAQVRYAQEFIRMRDRLQRQQNEEWKESRLHGKQARKELTDVIQAFVAYAKAQGSQNAQRYYGNLTTMTYKALGLLEKGGKVGPGFRNLLNSTDLNCLNMAELVALDAIQQGMDEDMPYKDIYKFASAKVEALANQILPVLRVRRLSA